VDDFRIPRRNVLVCYGVGGIGKTEFSKRVEAHLSDSTDRWTPAPAEIGRVLPIRIDLAKQAGAGFEDVILAIRIAVGRLGRPMPAFDLALRRYWEVNHPGATLDEYLQRNGFLRRVGEAVALPEQVQSVVEDIAADFAVPGLIGALTQNVVGTIINSIREKRSTKQTLSRCHRLPELLAAEQDLETLSFFPYLLAWDLAQLPPDESGLPVVLLDTFEEIGDRSNRDFERLLQRVVWLMPNALFIITGRNRLQWDDDTLEGQLDWTGPQLWPTLSPGVAEEPGQHLVGYLSGADRELYLRTRLLWQNEPVIPADVRQTISRRSHGLPLFLDLAVMHFIDVWQQSGAPPGPSEFERDFPALVARVMRDLSSSERTVLRTVSLLDSFTIELVANACGIGHGAATVELARRPFITHDPDMPWPYKLHDLVRSSIREADATAEDRWTPDEWHRAARQVFGELRAHLPAPGDANGRRHLLTCLVQGLRLACDHDFELDWLIDAAHRYVRQSVWEPIEIPCERGTVTGESPQSVVFAAALSAIADRQRRSREETAAELHAILDLGVLHNEADDLVRYYLAETQRHLGQHAASSANLRAIVAHRGPMAADAARGLAHISRHLGDFPAALDATEQLPHDNRHSRALGHLWWVHGDVDRACLAYSTARELASQENNRGQAALAQAGLALAASLSASERGRLQIELAHRMLRDIRLSWAETHVRIAELIADAGRDAQLPHSALDLEADARAASIGSSVAYIRLAVCFHHAVRRDDTALSEARARLQRSTEDGEYTYLLEISHFLDNSPAPTGLTPARWIDSATIVAQRWHQLVTNRRTAIQ
jgi:hypothetical protein